MISPSISGVWDNIGIPNDMHNRKATLLKCFMDVLITKSVPEIHPLKYNDPPLPCSVKVWFLYMIMKNTSPFIIFGAGCLMFFSGFSCSSNRNGETTAAHLFSQVIDSLLQNAVATHEIPGAAACISLNGEAVYHQAHGWRNMESGVPLEKDDIFRMASMTKGLTAVAVMQLVEEGALRLDDEIYRYLPEFKNPQILIEVLPDSAFTGRPATGEITVRQLLTHTSGIGYGFQNERYNALIIKNDISEGFEDDTRDSYENIRRLAGLPLLFEPGEAYVYGLSYDVLGVLIEQVSGLRFDRYIEKHILDPLQMKDSYFMIPEEEQFRLVSVYQPAVEGPGIEPASYPDTAYPVINDRQFFSGGADLCSTAEDYARFLTMLVNDGELQGTRILRQSSVDTMLSKQTPFDDGGYDQGFAAWIINEKGAEHGPMGTGAFEFGGFYDTYSWADPQHHLVAVLLLQMYPTNAYSIHQKFQDAVYRIIRK
jgi:CubicO group peptidase (beta-lactamase class C family)